MSSNLSRHIAIRSPNEPLREHSLEPGKNTIGRHPDSDIFASDEASSRRHAELTFELDTNSITVLDLKSTNGTFINGKKITRPYEIEPDDVLRIGRMLISFLPLKEKLPRGKPKDRTKSIVTSELVIESIDNYSVLLYDIGAELINVPDLSAALGKISSLIERIIGAEECSIIMLDHFAEIQPEDIPPEILNGLQEENAATIYGLNPEGIEKKGSQGEISVGSRLVAPVQVDGKTIAIIMAKKSELAIFPFGNSDLKIVIAACNQIALVIQRNRLEEQLLHNATHDGLTGLPSRTVFIDRLSQSLEISKRRKDYSFAVLFLDVDNFKIINDTYGHQVGDKLLIELSNRINKDLRTIDTLTYLGSVARFGGDEFAVLLTDYKDAIDPLSVARRVRELAAEPFDIDGINIEISMSVGLTTNSLEYENPDDLLRDADIAMYRAKDSGKARVELYDQEFHLDLMERLEKQDAVRKAVETNEFRLHYQPTISLETGRIIGHEALLRWHIPNRGIVLANQFISILDTSNLLVSIDQWVIKEACRQTMKWQKAFPDLPPLHISVNLCTETFVDPKIVDHIGAVLAKTKLPPESLWIEITENLGIEINDISLDILNQLQSMGIHLCLDDFGTGFSSLNYLVDLPINTVKIDASIIGKIDTVEGSRKITNTVIALAKQLEMTVVAEGIENEAQFSLLKSLGCDYAQGFLFGKAILGDEVSKLLKSNPIWE